MLFSETFSLKLRGDEKWFDPILTVDTPLYVDPFLIFDNESDEFVGAHSELIDFFNETFKEVAKSRGDRKSPYWKTATGWLLFPEVEEACLGSSSGDTGGLGSAGFIATQIASAIWKSIDSGRSGLGHWEEVQLFEKGIARDRISDATLGIVRRRFATYTNKICRKLKIDMCEVNFERMYFDGSKRRWISGTIELPQNPYNKKPILLVPKKYLRADPSISAGGFASYLVDFHADILRKEFGDEINRKIDKETILEIVEKYPELPGEFAKSVEDRGSKSYDLKRDEDGVYRWYNLSRSWSSKRPLNGKLKTKADFLAFVNKMVDEYSNFVTNNAGWSLLWNDDNTTKPESAAQTCLLGIVKHYCAANNVDVSKEANIGRGPVDFKFSAGNEVKLLLEVKLARNTKFWNGLMQQLPKYMEAETIDQGIFLVVCYTDKDFEKTTKINAKLKDAALRAGYKINVRFIDARRAPPSASKLK